MFKVPIYLSKHPANSSVRWTKCITSVSECSIKKCGKVREFRMDRIQIPICTNLIRIMN